MEHKFANIQTAFDFLSTLLNLNGDQSKWRGNKDEHEEGYNAYPKFRPKSNK